jgi:endoribonuclease Dicer
MQGVTVSYLTRALVQESFALPQALIDLEAYSYVCDFCKEFGFDGDNYKAVYCALRSSSLDASHNYESLETLGDTVLKFLTSFHHFLIYKKDDEGWLTRRRTYIINNTFLAQIGYEQGIQRYLKAQAQAVSRWKPPYFNSAELVFKKTVVHRLTPGMVADSVEACIGAFFVAKGLVHAIEFIDRIGLIKRGADWTAVKNYCDNSPFELLSAATLNELVSSNMPLGELIPRPTTVLATGSQHKQWDTLLKDMHFAAKDPDCLREVFTHSSIDETYNYERLEFLGDSLLDLVVLSNIYKSSDEPIHPHTMTLMHHALVNNNILAYYSISLQLHSYLLGTPEVNDYIDRFMTELKWEDDLINFGVHCQDPPKYLADLFESLGAAILLDSGSVSVACKVIQTVMAKPMAYLSKNREHCQSNIVTRAKEFVQKRGARLMFKTVETGDEVTVAAMVGERELSRHTASTRWLAERFAANKAYHILVSS